MADNLTSPVPAGTKIASKDVGGVHIPRNIITDEAGVDAIGAVGASPAANTLLGRLKAIADAVLGTLKISAAELPLPSGAATDAKQDAIIAAIGGATYYPAIQPVSGDVSIAGPVAVTGDFYPATQPVSIASPVAVTGTFFQATQPVSATSLPLPTGAATAAKQDGIISALGGTLAVSATALPLPAGAATAAKQDQIITPLDAMVSTAAPFDITPHATNALPRPIKALSITTAGTVVFRHPDEGSDRTVTLPAGLFPIRATHIRATSTAAGLTGF